MYFILLLLSLQAARFSPPAAPQLCEVLHKAGEWSMTPEKFRSGEGKQEDLMRVYDCALKFNGATKAEARFWNSGKLSNVIQYLGESVDEQQAIQIFDKAAASFRNCFPAEGSGDNATGLREDVSAKIHDNLLARLTIYPQSAEEDGSMRYNVFFDLFYTGP